MSYTVRAAMRRRLVGPDCTRQLQKIADDTRRSQPLVLQVPPRLLPPFTGVAYFRTEARCPAVLVECSDPATTEKWTHALDVSEVWA